MTCGLANVGHQATFSSSHFSGFSIPVSNRLWHAGDAEPKPNALKILEGTRADRVGATASGGCQGGTGEIRRSTSTTTGSRPGIGWPPSSMRSVCSRNSTARRVGLYCSTYSRWLKKAQRELGSSCSIVTDRGTEKSNPAAAVVAECSRG